MNLKKTISFLTSFLFVASAFAQVTVYEHDNFTGKSQTYKEGTHALSLTIGKNVLSSVKVSSGWKVTLYQNDQNSGKSLVLTSDANELIKQNFNDIVSSIKVERINHENTLKSGEVLVAGKQLKSANGKFILRMQDDDGHLCVYKIENGKQGDFVWGSEKFGFKNAKLTMQTDGNLVVSDGSNSPKWASGTHPFIDVKFKDTKNKPTKLVLEDDGSLKLYSNSGVVVWTNK